MIIDDVTEFLKDGRHVDSSTISQQLGEPEETIREVLRFCVDFNIVTMDEMGRACLTNCFRRLCNDSLE